MPKVLNGKMNLTQAEAVADLIAAQGQQSAQAALQARDGLRLTWNFTTLKQTLKCIRRELLL